MMVFIWYLVKERCLPVRRSLLSLRRRCCWEEKLRREQSRPMFTLPPAYARYLSRHLR